MPLPSERQLIDGLLQAMHFIGRVASNEEQELEVRRVLNVSEADAELPHDSLSSRTELSYRLAWGRTYLKSLGLIRQVDRGTWTLTDDGRKYKSVSDLPDADIENAADLFEGGSEAEGFGSNAPEEFGEYPIDSVLIRQEVRTVFEIVRRIRDGRFIMDPDFQRDFIWNNEADLPRIKGVPADSGRLQ